MAKAKGAHLFQKGKSGNPKGRPARPKLPDKYTFEVAKILIEQGCCPFTVLAKLAMEAKSEKVQCEAATQLAKYVAPQLKLIDPPNLTPDDPYSMLFHFTDPKERAAYAEKKAKAAEGK